MVRVIVAGYDFRQGSGFYLEPFPDESGRLNCSDEEDAAISIFLAVGVKV